MRLSDIESYVDQFESKVSKGELRKILKKRSKHDYKWILYSKNQDARRHAYWKRRNLSKEQQIFAEKKKRLSFSKRIKLKWRFEHEAQHVELLKKELEYCTRWNTNCERGRVTPFKLRKIFKRIMERKIEEFFKDEKDTEKRKIMCIVGPSGSGKTLASLHLKYKLGANVVCSFTNRPPRPTEVDGRDHHFIDIHPDETDILAITNFGGFKYYALKNQIYGPCTVYVIDEDGLRDLIDIHGDEYRLIKVYITRDVSLRRKCKVGKLRMNRDKERKLFKRSFYDYYIVNNTTKAHLFTEIEKIYNTIKEMK